MPSSRLVDWLRRVLLLVVVAVVLVLLWSNWDEVGPHLGAVSWQAWTLAVLISLLAPLLTMFGWRAVLTDLGSRLSLGNAAGIFLVGQLGKYVPGSVWSVVVQTEMAAKVGVPRRRAGVTGVITLVLSLLTGVVVGLPALPAFVNRGERVSLVLVALAVAVLLVAVYPPVLNAIVSTVLRLARRPPLEHPLTGASIALMAMWFVLAWLAMGVAVWVIAADVAAGGGGALEGGGDGGAGLGGSTAYFALVCVSGFALASAIGMLSVLLPAGVGVREAVLVLLLAGLLTAPAATAVVILARFLTLLADVIWAVAGWLWDRAHGLGVRVVEPTS
ncbi:MAG: lysylphosphatidylglycerol synthase domain-containing protein [Actinomycetia bacterium]|nr:lysylphosphatidylglycerol synthase domain-containing protein [Actinomycetes bacterium]